MSSKSKFLKPGELGFNNDRSDLDPSTGSSFVYNANARDPLSRQRQKLPVFAVKKHILYLLEKHQTLVVVGETGSGKSTQIPQYLLESGWCSEGMLAITQPRRVACTTLASRVALERDCILGAEVGYTIRFDDCTTRPGSETNINSADITKINYLTEAILVREMMADPLLRQYSCVMLDEVHERTLFTDVLLGLLKKILKRRKDLRVIVCSATIDAKHMQQFFNFNKTKDTSKDTAVVMSIAGRMYPVEVHYLKEPCADYVSASASAAHNIHQTQPPGDVLIFLTSVLEVDTCVQQINALLGSNKSKSSVSSAVVYPMHGSLPSADQLKVFQFAGPTVRKIIVATNIAETSITIPGIVYVVDCGLVKVRLYGQHGGSGALTDGLVVVTASKAAATQRAGRAGRTRPGKVYRLYTESEFANLPTTTPPEMLRTNLSPAVLNLLALGITNMLRFDFPSPPPAKHLMAALEELAALGAVSPEVALTQPLGQRMAELPLAPHLAKMLLVAEEHGCSADAASLVALLQLQEVLVTPASKTHQARIMHAKFQVEEGDLLTLLNVYTAWERHGRCQRWCSRHFVSHKALLRASEIRSRICSLLRKWGVADTNTGGRISSVSLRRCITAGLFINAAYLHHSGEYRSVRGDTSLAIHPSSVLYTLHQPKWIVYHEVLHSSRTFMRDLTVIEEDWLLELAPHYYQHGTVSEASS